MRQELDIAHEEIERLKALLISREKEATEDKMLLESALDLSIKMPPPQESEIPLTLSPRVPGIRGFKVDWELNENMDPLERLRLARFAVKNLHPTDLQKPKGAPLIYLETALRRAAILTSSEHEEISDVWECQIQSGVEAIPQPRPLPH